ncbi:hypothetical protein N7456_003788 [Penicillium angulare]|uniref:Uncharacterized protein n=1 Tax=Penicillium angulare TaxID=116970 RepID=A0A9W9KIY1_9EURO|nr:hypothetical protein N7456_003788 [Penicillium angulare]
MALTLMASLLLAAVARAAPLTDLALNSTKWTTDHVLQHDEVILYGEGRMEVVHESIYHALISEQGLSRIPPEEEPALSGLSSIGKNHTNLHARDECGLTTAVVTDKSQTFIDWDVQMSPVVIGTGTGIDVYVSSGYSVSNSVSVSAGLDIKDITEKLGASLGIDYTKTWTTQTVINIKGNVQDGYSGVMITKPVKTRKTGRTLQGCLGAQKQTGTFSADSFDKGSYGGVEWVSGAITMCTKKEFPLSRCSGSGNFV